MANESFIISTSGEWPNEVYNINLNFDIIDVNLEKILAENKFKYFNSTITELDSDVTNNSYNFINSFYGVVEENGKKQTKLIFNNDSKFVFDPKNIRKTNAGDFFNFFKLIINNPADETSIQFQNELNRSYLIYPYKLHLKPISAEKISENDYRLVTSAVLISASNIFLDSFDTDSDAFLEHKAHKNYTYIPLPSTVNLFYTFSANECYSNRQLLFFTPQTENTSYYNPSEQTLLLNQKGYTNIQPDTTIITYDVSFFPNELGGETEIRFAQLLSDEYDYNPGLGSSYLTKYNPLSSDVLTFQMVQSSVDDTLLLHDTKNSILSCDINLKTTKTNYFNFSIPKNEVITPLIFGYPNSKIGLRYVADLANVYGVPVSNFVDKFLLDSYTQNVLNLSSLKISTSSLNTQKATWQTNQPPHYFSYKLSFNSSEFGYETPTQTDTLNFNLSSGVLILDTFSAKFINTITSNLKTLELDISTYAKNDLFYLKPIQTSTQETEFFSVLLSTFACYYSPDDINYVSYNLNDPTWINASSAKYFKIEYDREFGEIDLTLRPILSTSIGTNIESFETIRLKFAKGYQQQPKQTIYLERLDEEENFVVLSVNHLVDEQVYPYKNLSNSLITWSVEPSSTDFQINAIDEDNNFIQNIVATSAVTFDSTTNTVKISGYGAQAITVTVSSEKYDQTSSYITDNTLFNIFSDRLFEVGKTGDIINYEKTKFIQLSAKILHKGKAYPIPVDTPIYWSWSYDDITNPLVMPITSNYAIDNKKYNYAQRNFAYLLSSINLNIGNNLDVEFLKNKSTPLKRNIDVFLYSNITNPPISGNYSFLIENYPSREVFNTDFSTVYNVFPSDEVISDTRNNQFVITRPNSDNNYFKFYANTDIIPTLSAERFHWKAVTDTGLVSEKFSSSFSEISSFNYNIVNPSIRVTTISLCAINAIVPNWRTPYSTETKIKIYTEPYQEFYKKFEFLVIPPYTWGLSGQYLIQIDGYNYTLAQSPTAYRNKKSNSQGFYLSANKSSGFDSYKVYVGDEKTYFGTLTSNYGYLEFPYRSEFFLKSGLKIAIEAYGPKYPEYNGINYTTTEINYNITKAFALSSQTVPHGSTLNDKKSSLFTQAPKLIPYDDITFSFNTSFTSIDLDEMKVLTVDQYFKGKNGIPLSAQPTQHIQQILSGLYIVYKLSSEYWNVYQYVPALNGTYDLFILASGDPKIPLNVSKYKYTTLNLTASGNAACKIQPTTFDLYPTKPFTEDLVAFWKFDELSGRRIDSSGNGRHLDLFGLPSLTSLPLSAVGIIGKSLSAVSGVYLQPINNFDFGSDWTISYWEKLNADPTSSRKNNFITKSSDGSTSDPLSGLTISTAPLMLYDNAPFYNQSILFNGPFVTKNKWNHIVFSATNKYLSVYINNILLADRIFLSDALVDYIKTSNGYPFRINGTNQEVYLDAMGIWSRGLKSSDVYNLYNSGSASQHPFENVLEHYTGERDLWETVYKTVTAGPLTLVAYSTTVMPEVYLSTYYALTGERIYLQYETPENTQNVYISTYRTNFGENSGITFFSDASSTVEYIYSTPGVYNISFEVTYNTGQVKNLSLETPITIYQEWPKYDQQKIRLLNEATLEFGNNQENTYSLNDIEIQPNEFADVDIFNTAITRLYNNFEYIRFNSQTIKTTSPTLFYGWLGCESNNTERGIQWNTKDYGFFEWDKPYLGISSNTRSFSSLRSISEVKDHILVLDGSTMRAFSAGKIPNELIFENWNDISPLIPNPVSIDSFTDENQTHYCYVTDSIRNKVYKFNLDFSYIPYINVQLNVGMFGSKDEPNKFNSPTDICYSNDYVYVLDYGNKCVKQFTTDLNWAHTFYTNDFENNQPESVKVHPNPNISFVYILTNKNKIYVFDQFETDYFQIIDLPEIEDNVVVKMTLDDTGDFIYIITTNIIYKYSSTGLYIGRVDIPNSSSLEYFDIKSSSFKSILIASKNIILKIQDIVQYFRVGEGLEQNYWGLEQLKLKRDEFAEDINYNRSFLRFIENLKNYRDTIDSKFVLTTEQVEYGTVTYFTLIPISTENRPVFSDYIENNDIGIGVNEFHIPQVLNREFKKLFDALNVLRENLNISDIKIQQGVNNGCSSPFCWSWKSMSCYNLSLPVIRICNVNPITYVELEDNFPIKYSPTTLWGEASSTCCREFNSLNPLYKI
jgi:hypothetical protein